jgi:hypothetical protein
MFRWFSGTTEENHKDQKRYFFGRDSNRILARQLLRYVWYVYEVVNEGQKYDFIIYFMLIYCPS